MSSEKIEVVVKSEDCLQNSAVGVAGNSAGIPTDAVNAADNIIKVLIKNEEAETGTAERSCIVCKNMCAVFKYQLICKGSYEFVCSDACLFQYKSAQKKPGDPSAAGPSVNPSNGSSRLTESPEDQDLKLFPSPTNVAKELLVKTENAQVHQKDKAQNSAVGAAGNSKAIPTETDSAAAEMREGGKRHECPTCGKYYGHASTLHRHISSIHEGHKFACKECGKQFTQKAYLKSHAVVHSGARPYVCDMCGKGFTLTMNLTRHLFDIHLPHLKVHEGVKRHQCPTCGKCYRQASSLNVHIGSIHEGHKFACKVCGKQFTQKAYLKLHAVVHSGAKPYVCDICGKRFTLTINLTRHHFDIHLTIKAHQCPVCHKRFGRSSYIERHMSCVHPGHKIQTKLSKIVCEKCGKQFTTKCHLKSHALVHSGARPFMCDMCGNGFTHASSLAMHINTVHLHIKAHQCPVCHRRFARSAHVDRHMRCVHPGHKIQPKLMKLTMFTEKREVTMKTEDSPQNSAVGAETNSDQVSADTGIATAPAVC